MPVAQFVCPHCEKSAEVQVTYVTRSRPCPHCGRSVMLQIAGKDKMSRRKALLVTKAGSAVPELPQREVITMPPPTKQREVSPADPPVKEVKKSPSPKKVASKTKPGRVARQDVQPTPTPAQELRAPAPAAPTVSAAPDLAETEPLTPVTQRPEMRGSSGPAYEPQPLQGDVFERMKLDPEIKAYRRKFILGIAGIAGLIVLTIIGNVFFSSPEVQRPRRTSWEPEPQATASAPKPAGPKALPRNAVGLSLKDESTANSASPTRLSFDAPLIGDSLAAKESDPLSRRVVNCVEKFFQASSIDDLLGTVADRKKVEPAIRKFVGDKPIVATPYRQIRITNRTDLDEPEILVEIGLTGAKRVLALVTTDEGRPLVDWDSFMKWSDMPWTELVKAAPVQAQLIRAYATKAGRFDGDYGDAEKYVCVKLEDPLQPANAPIFAYAEKGSPAAEQLRPVLGDAQGKPGKLTLHVGFPSQAKLGDQVFIDRVVAQRWAVRESVVLLETK
jgi:hypothetical protein